MESFCSDKFFAADRDRKASGGCRQMRFFMNCLEAHSDFRTLNAFEKKGLSRVKAEENIFGARFFEAAETLTSTADVSEFPCSLGSMPRVSRDCVGSRHSSHRK